MDQDLKWLERKLKNLNSFDGSLLSYVSSPGGNANIPMGLKEISPSSLLKLDANENFFVSCATLNSILRGIVNDIDLRFYDPNGVAELNMSLGKYAGVPPECIVASSGSEQLIDLVVDLFLEQGNSVISVVPSFFMYQKRVKLKKADFLGVPLNRDLSLSAKAILEAATSKTRLVFICSPNNPTGNQFDYREIEALASKTSAILVLDEAYAEFAGSSFASMAVKKKNVIVLRTFSKGFGLAGLRFGYAVANPDLAMSLSNVIPYTVSTVTSKFVVNLLKSIDTINESLEMAKAERKRLIDKLNRIKGIKVFNSDANFVTFKPKNGANAIHQKLLQQGILIKNLGDLPVIGHCLRVTVGLPEMNDRFISALSEILRTP